MLQISMIEDKTRWTLANLHNALKLCRLRKKQGICCTFDVLGEDIKTENDTEIIIQIILDCAHTLENQNLDASIAIKPTSLGATLNKDLERNNILKLFQETEKLKVNLEIDMEGTPLVQYTIDTAMACAERGYYVTLALQVYLDRTPDDIKDMLDNNITIRLVKGAYLGDTEDFVEIQERFKNCYEILLESCQYFSVGTHDPELVEWIKTCAEGNADLFEFGFLKGLADETKLELVKAGWAVCEYIPFGVDSKAYIKRRERYLKDLEKLNRKSVP